MNRLGNLSFVFICSLACITCNRSEKKKPATELQTRTIVPTVINPNFVPHDTTDQMMASYIASLGPDVPAKLRAWTIDADALRKYLDDTTIREFSINLAHAMSYINNGNFGVPAGFSPNALTVVLNGINASGAIVYYQDNYALNRAKPCPPTCVTTTAHR